MKKRYYDEWEKPRRRAGQVVKYTLIMLAVVVFLLGCMIVYFSSMDFQEQATAQLRLTPTPVPTLIADAAQTPSINLYAPLADAMSQNADTVAWINIEGTLVNYPVVRTHNNTYYMENGYDKNRNSAGAIFLDKDSDLGGVHLILYGKAMADGSRFAALLKYKDESYMLDNSIITLETSSGRQMYEIFAAYARPQDFDPLQAKFDTVEAWREHVKKCAAYSMYENDYGDGWGKVLTLVAFDGESGQEFIVHAGLVS